jgi:hypothetical protein
MRQQVSISLLAVGLALALMSCGDDSSETTAAATSATSSAQRETGEQSIERFGEEAGGSEREAILAAKQEYLNALASEDYAAACELLSRQTRLSIERFAGQSRANDCAEVLVKVLARSAAATARLQANGEIAKVRVEGEQAFVIFSAPGAKLYVFTFVRESNEWKAATVSPSILVPDPATLE